MHYAKLVMYVLLLWNILPFSLIILQCLNAVYMYILLLVAQGK